MKKTIKDLQVDTSTLKTQAEGNLEMGNSGTLTGNSEASLTNRTEVMEEKILGIEDTIEEIDTFVKKC